MRAVPTTAEVKVERALSLFNESRHQRTVAGLARSLGQPWVTAMPDPDAPATVTVLVAWELSWYRYRVDLGDAAEPVAQTGKGDELNDIDEELRDFNAATRQRRATGDRGRGRMIYCVVPMALEDELFDRLRTTTRTTPTWR